MRNEFFSNVKPRSNAAEEEPFLLCGQVTGAQISLGLPKAQTPTIRLPGINQHVLEVGITIIIKNKVRANLRLSLFVDRLEERLVSSHVLHLPPFRAKDKKRSSMAGECE